ncbi:MAG TPA: DNA repair protein RecN [Dehalococcoidia bacterium]|nr:DNA repair protein RecN [Dehalococcoidia bacterium]
MLAELYVKNLAVIEELRIRFKPGLTVLSGDEGAGKSLLVDALCLLLGGRASGNLVRSGASSAMVEGVFWASQDDQGLAAVLQEAGLQLEGDGSLIMAREVQEQGRSIARANGRAVPVSLLRDLGHRLMDINSQTDHLSLLNPQRQIDLLDGYGGTLEVRSRLSGRLAELRERTREIGSVTDGSAQRQRELLEYQVAEIEAAKLELGEDEALQQEWHILQRSRALEEGCHAAHNALYGDSISASGLVHQAAKALRGMVLIDPALHSHLEALASAASELEETARDLRSYAEGVEARSGRLEEVEERLELLRRLKGKYGPTLEDVLAFAAKAGGDLDGLLNQEERRCYLEDKLRCLEEEAGRLAEGLSAARRDAAMSLAERVNGELLDLGMPWARFDVSLAQEERSDGLPTSRGRYFYNQYGIDRVGFLGVTNPGEPLKPLADIASGGETCRFMLAVKTALSRADSVPTLVFDEIDMGVGGRNAHVVGKKLAALARDRQVICITHLPQIACYGQNHYRVRKEVSSGRAISRIEELAGDSRIEELAAMLGSRAGGAMLESAQELLRGAEEAGSLTAEAQRAQR